MAPVLTSRGAFNESDAVRKFFSPNVGSKGRLARGVCALLLFVGAGFAFAVSNWLGLVLAASGAFVFFEALRGWCALRACGVKTRL